LGLERPAKSNRTDLRFGPRVVSAAILLHEGGKHAQKLLKISCQFEEVIRAMGHQMTSHFCSEVNIQGPGNCNCTASL
jgi:hypothetical protein